MWGRTWKVQCYWNVSSLLHTFTYAQGRWRNEGHGKGLCDQLQRVTLQTLSQEDPTNDIQTHQQFITYPKCPVHLSVSTTGTLSSARSRAWRLVTRSEIRPSGSDAVASLSGDSNCHDLPSQSSACLQTRGQVRGQGLAELWQSLADGEESVCCQILPAFAICYFQAVFNKLAKFMPDQTEKITKDTMYHYVMSLFAQQDEPFFAASKHTDSTNSFAESLKTCSFEMFWGQCGQVLDNRRHQAQGK